MFRRRGHKALVVDQLVVGADGPPHLHVSWAGRLEVGEEGKHDAGSVERLAEQERLLGATRQRAVVVGLRAHVLADDLHAAHAWRTRQG